MRRINLKSIVMLIGVLLCIVMTTACGSSTERAIKEASESLPKRTAIGTILGINLPEDNDSVGVKFYILGGDDVHIDVLQSDSEVAMGRIMEALNDSIFFDLYSSLDKEGKGIDVYIKGISALDDNILLEQDFYLMPSLIKDIKNPDTDYDLNYAKYAMAYWNLKWSDNKYFDKDDLNPLHIEINEGTVKWVYGYDGEIFDTEKLYNVLNDKSKSDRWVKMLLKGMRNVSILSVISNRGYDVTFTLHNMNSGKEISITITNERFKSLVKEIQKEISNSAG